MDKPRFVRTASGRYRAIGVLTEEDIVRQAAHLMAERIATGPVLSDSEAVARYLQLQLAPASREQFGLLLLDSRHRALHFEVLFQGTLEQAAIHPRVVVQTVLAHRAGAVIVAHNHPSGDLTPSAADLQLTRRIQEALGLIDVPLLDHLIVSSQGWTRLATVSP